MARRLAVGALAGGAAALARAVWWRRNPSACPYGQRIWVELPHPLITRARLRDILAPRAGERLLEVGPGTGYYSLAVAEALGPRGQLDLLDLQSEMLEHAAGRARERGLSNLIATQGDARALPYPAGAFDGAFLCTTLGEVPDQDAALSELRRVLKPNGRLVVGELLLGDPHGVRFGRLRERADAAGLRFERRVGGPLGYFARFSPRSAAPGGVTMSACAGSSST